MSLTNVLLLNTCIVYFVVSNSLKVEKVITSVRTVEMIVWSHEARFKPVTLWCRHDVTLLIQTMALVFTTPSDEASWAVRVIFFKVDISCRLSGVLTEWFSGMFTPRELLASQSCHWHLCLFLRLLLLLGLNDVAKGKKRRGQRQMENKVLTAENCLAVLTTHPVSWSKPLCLHLCRHCHLSYCWKQQECLENSEVSKDVSLQWSLLRLKRKLHFK